MKKHPFPREMGVFCVPYQQPKPNSEQSILKKLFMHMTVASLSVDFPSGCFHHSTFYAKNQCKKSAGNGRFFRSQRNLRCSAS
jgi:hypothetical protein